METRKFSELNLKKHGGAPERNRHVIMCFITTGPYATHLSTPRYQAMRGPLREFVV